VQTAVALAEEFETSLGMTGEFNPAEAHGELLLRSGDLETIRTRYSSSQQRTVLLRRDWRNPLLTPGLADELEDAAEEILEFAQALDTGSAAAWTHTCPWAAEIRLGPRVAVVAGSRPAPRGASQREAA